VVLQRCCKAEEGVTISGKKEFIEDVRRALYCRRYQLRAGYMLLRRRRRSRAEPEHGGIALMCAAAALSGARFWQISSGVRQEPKLQNLLLDDSSRAR